MNEFLLGAVEIIYALMGVHSISDFAGKKNPAWAGLKGNPNITQEFLIFSSRKALYPGAVTTALALWYSLSQCSS